MQDFPISKFPRTRGTHEKNFFFVTLMVSVAAAVAGPAQVRKFSPVTPAMLLNPPPDDWLMYSRTYDAQRYSPLNQINKQNAGRLTQVWSSPTLCRPARSKSFPSFMTGSCTSWLPLRKTERHA